MIVVNHPQQGRTELGDDTAMALKALAIGYHRIHRFDGLMLMFLGLARKTKEGFVITREGFEAIIWEKYDGDQIQRPDPDV